MKKITKRIMALMLSLVMILGCVPNFVNEASAAFMELQQVLPTAKGGFPSNEAAAWTNGNGGIAYGNSSLSFKVNGIWKNTITNATGFTLVGSDYVNDEYKIILHMTDNKLTSIEVTGNVEYAGIYKPNTIEEVSLSSMGFLTTTSPTYAPASSDTDKYTVNNTDTWKDALDVEATTFTKGETYHKTLKLTPKAGFEFDSSKVPSISVDGIGLNVTPTVEADGTLTFTISKISEGNVVYISYNQDYDTYAKASAMVSAASQDIANRIISNLAVDTTYSYFQIDTLQSYPWINIIYTFVKFTDDSLNTTKSVDDIYLDGVKIVNEDNQGKWIEKALKLEPFWYYASATGTYVLATPIDCGKALEMTVSGREAGKTKEDIVVTCGTTEETNAYESFSLDVQKEGGDLLRNDEKFEAGKKYTFYYLFNLGSNIAHSFISDSDPYKEVVINGEHISRLNTSSDGDYLIVYKNSKMVVTHNYTIPAAPSSGSSKTYKAANTNKTAEKISGSGKKGSKRTIIPIEGKKVGRVTVTDKDGNKVDVTLNEDGTYSFIQPASNVDVVVIYVNREITLTIGSMEASVDGEKSNLDVCPITRNDRTMLPIRFVAENLGAKVEWDEKHPELVVITKGDIKIEITLGSDTMKVNGKEVKLDSVAFAENDRTYLPVRAISENLNAIVEWNEERPMEVKIYER